MRALLATAGGLYFAAAEFTPFDRIDAWIDDRLFWEPIGLTTLALLLVLAIRGGGNRRSRADNLGPSAPRAPSELVPICMHCKAVQNGAERWEPIEVYLAYRTPDKFTRSLCPACPQRLA